MTLEELNAHTMSGLSTDNRLDTLLAYAEDTDRPEIAAEIREMLQEDLYPEVPSAAAQRKVLTGRVLPTINRTVDVPSDAGWNPHVELTRDLEAAQNASIWHVWRRQLEEKLRAVIEHFETDDASSMDMMQVADGLTRMMDKILDKKQEAGKKAQIEMRVLERETTDTEIELNQMVRVERRIKMLRNSWWKFKQGYETALLTRNWADGYTGSNWSQYIPNHAMIDNARKHRKNMQLHAFSRAVEGRDEAAYNAALTYYIAQLDGIDADDGLGGTAEKKKALAHKQHLARKQARGYQRSRPAAMPKPNTDFEASGEPGSAYVRLVRSQKGGGGR